MYKHLLVVSLMALGIGLCSPWHASAAEENKGKEAEESKTKIPDTLAGIWNDVKQQEGEVRKMIDGKMLDMVHEHAFAIRDLVNAMPDKSKDLPADKLEKVKTNAKYVADLADRLDKSGDAKDEAGTEANFKKLQGILKTIEAQYPPEALKPEKKD